MSNQYNLSVVITTSDEFSREDTVEYVERLLSNLEDTDSVHQTHVKRDGIDELQAERLLSMLAQLSEQNVENTRQTIDKIADE